MINIKARTFSQKSKVEEADAAEELTTRTFDNLMIDIETLGTKPGYVILSIGAVFFDIKTGKTGETFYKKINLKSSMNAGFKIDPDTLLWWAKQDKGAYLEALDIDNASKMGTEFNTVMSNLHNWIQSTPLPDSNLQVWGNSARFDLGMLETYFQACSMDLPWSHYYERDVRTIVMFAPYIKDSIVKDKDGKSITSHKPIEDCMKQIEYTSAIFNKIEVHE